jgi:hypothetical protein
MSNCGVAWQFSCRTLYVNVDPCQSPEQTGQAVLLPISTAMALLSDAAFATVRNGTGSSAHHRDDVSP